MKHLILLTILTISLMSCGGGVGGCKMGKPQPMFEAGLKGLSGHNFLLKEDNSSVESFDFNGDPVVIYQTGCDAIAQEFQFNFKKKTGEDKEGLDKIAGILMAWSKLGEKQVSFASWAQQIKIISGEMRFGQTFNPSPSIEIGLDRINKIDGELITMTLEQKQ